MTYGNVAVTYTTYEKKEWKTKKHIILRIITYFMSLNILTFIKHFTSECLQQDKTFGYLDIFELNSPDSLPLPTLVLLREAGVQNIWRQWCLRGKRRKQCQINEINVVIKSYHLSTGNMALRTKGMGCCCFDPFEESFWFFRRNSFKHSWHKKLQNYP